MAEEAKKKGAMSVSEAGRKGGQTVRDKYGHSFYEEIGKKGGHKVRQLIEEGKKAASEALAARNEEMEDENIPAVGGEVAPAVPE